MDGCHMCIDALKEDVLAKLSQMLDNSTCGWRQLATAAAKHPRFQCSEKEMTACSLHVLNAAGSPARCFLAHLADRRCPLDFLSRCLTEIDHREAAQLISTTMAELIRITAQPQSQHSRPGSRVLLTCGASGPPGLTYQWFKGNEEILDQTGGSPQLVLFPLSPAHQGHYICRVSYGERYVFSQWAHVGLVCSAGSSPGCSSSLFPGSVSGLQVVLQPQSQVVSEGAKLRLECQAKANPPAQVQWYHNNKPLPQKKTPVLEIPCVTTEHRGEYSCKVYNLYHEVWTDAAAVNIEPSSVPGASWVEVEEDFDSEDDSRSHPPQQTSEESSSAKNFYATDKVALLIGNMNYLHHTPLCAPICDVHELTNLLRQMDFKVVSLLDLSWQEMQNAVAEFLMLLDKGVYGLLYFAGHGYENYGNSFMVPIDAPASYTSDHCLCVQSILSRMQEKQTGLNVFLLDMCRQRNFNDDVIVHPGPLRVTANIVFGYATCVDAEAYEVKREDTSNGIFISFLKQRVCENEKVTVMLDRVGEDMGRCAITRGRQALELRSNLSERRSLTDPIQTSDGSASQSARNHQWAVAHDLPKSQCLHFDCGVQVQLGFAAEFSNVMVIYTRILVKPEEVVSCSAQLTDFAEDVDVDLKKSNQDCLIEAGSLGLIEEELPSPDVPSLYTRICNLQRLKKELTFTVCLHYTYSNMDEEIQERLPVLVGKPLVSKLNLHERRPTRSFSTNISLDSLGFSECSSFAFAEGPALSGSMSNASSFPKETSRADSPAKLRSDNVPEETDCPEFFHTTELLVSSKSLPHTQVNETSYRFSDMCNFHSL
ncbi:mucosa-associated lymphoid tissue lymphoma translocation protein 1-like isoform X1 [Oryzias latipes]|uniref:MALT paracaspase 2 n=1 Tax=Oryzias latipes TaxID=8090 RepID=A0A3B3I4Y7_ORYLA|nr:mucosa-associated lymphoid tissue lymphoma translocation protein 1-like isoform X1 [Oryzias latipes]